jgi:hypothetical protein
MKKAGRDIFLSGFFGLGPAALYDLRGQGEAITSH